MPKYPVPIQTGLSISIPQISLAPFSSWPHSQESNHGSLQSVLWPFLFWSRLYNQGTLLGVSVVEDVSSQGPEMSKSSLSIATAAILKRHGLNI